MRWLETTLASVRKDLPKPQWRRLQAALALTLSIDAMVVMKDVCRLPDAEAQEVLEWATLALLRAGRAETAQRNGAEVRAVPSLQRSRGRLHARRAVFVHRQRRPGRIR